LLARARADRRLHDHRRCRRICACLRGEGEEAGPEGRDRSAQQEDQLQGAGALAGGDPALIAVGSKEASENRVFVRRVGSNARSTMGADEAIAALAKEATPPDLREAG
jgi:hypothetical protein